MKYNLVSALVIGAAAISSPAHADARDDVLAGVVRCGAIADHRTWLDCFYGAAQPLRAELGLPPAPASQISLVPSQSLYPQQGLPAAPVMYAPRPPEKESGGIYSEIFGNGTIESDAHVSSYGFDKAGKLTITLANGEVWQQLPGDPSVAHWDKSPSHYVISIKQGKFGVYNLSADNEAGSYKVRRIQ